MKRNDAIVQFLARLDEQDQMLDRLLLNEAATLWTSPGDKAWSAMQCLEHLTLSGRYYQEGMRKKMAKAVFRRNDQDVRTGRIGRKMAKGMQPTEQGERRYKTKTFRSITPVQTDAERHQQIIDDYRNLQSGWRQLLEESREVDWNKLRVNSLVGPLIKFYLHDVFDLNLAHQARHLLQAQEAVGCVGILVR